MANSHGFATKLAPTQGLHSFFKNPSGGDVEKSFSLIILS
jgi:hypothetical protein